MSENYLVDFKYTVTEYGTVTLVADSPEHAEDLAYEYVKETFDEASNIEIESVQELTIGG